MRCFVAFTALFFYFFYGDSVQAQQDCDKYYLTIADTRNSDEAFKCYTAQKQYNRLILMHLNGEGTSKDPAKAASVLQEWLTSEPGESGSLEVEALRRAIAERVADPAAKRERIDFCDDIAGTTPDLNYCAALKAESAEFILNSEIESISSILAPEQKSLLSKVYSSYLKFREAEGQFTYIEYIDGSIRNIAALSQEAFVRDNFRTALESIVKKKTLQKRSTNDLKHIDQKLNSSYKKKLKDNADESLGSKSRTTEYKAAGKKVQLAWIDYRDDWSKFVNTFYSSDASVVTSTLYLLTEQRISEFAYGPIGGG